MGVVERREQRQRRRQQRAELPACAKFLVERLEVREEKLRWMAKASPRLLAVTEEEVERWAGRLMGTLEVSAAVLGKAVASCPQLLSEATCANAGEVARFLEEESGVARGDLSRLLLHRPQLFYSSVPHNLRPTVAFLVHEAGVVSVAVGKVVRMCPSVLTSSVERKLRPALLFLRVSLRLSLPVIGRIVASCPKVLFSACSCWQRQRQRRGCEVVEERWCCACARARGAWSAAAPPAEQA